MARGFKATLASRILYILANAGLMIALTRYLLTPEGYGRLTFALAVLGSMNLLIGLGIAKSGARYVTEYLEKDATQVVHVVKTTLGTIGISVALVGTSFWLFHVRIADLLGTKSLAPLLAVGVGYIVFYPFAISTRLLCNSFNRVTWSAILRAIDALCRLTIAIGLVLVGFGAVGALMGYVGGFAVASFVGVGIFYSRFYSGLESADQPEPGLRRRILSYGVPLTVTSAADVLDKRVDAILVGILINPVAVGFYTLAKQVADFTIVPAQSIDTTIAPRLGERKASGNVETGAQIYETALKHVLLLYVPAGVGLAIVAGPTVRFVFGPAYLGAVPVLQVFSGFIVVNAVNYITANSLDYLGRGRTRAVVNGGTSLSNLGLNLLLIPTLGVAGAALATLITHAIYTFANVYYLHRELPFDVHRVTFEAGEIVAISFGMGVMVWFALPFVTGLVSLVAVVGAGVLAWSGLSIASGLLDLALVREVVA